MEDRERHLVLASVVFAVPDNTPQMFGEEWFGEHEVFGEDFEIEQAIKTPPLTKYEFESGFVFEARQGRTEIKIPFGRDDNQDQRAELLGILGGYARRFADATKYLPYDAVGLNFKVAVESGGLDTITVGLPEGAQTQKVAFSLPGKTFVTKVELDTGTFTSTGTPVVIFSGNFHRELPEFDDNDSRYEKMEDTINRLSSCQDDFYTIIHDTNLE